jgi:hypothetical protein
MSSISTILNTHKMEFVCYADDIQIFVRSQLQDINAAISSLENCLDDVKKWLDASGLALNAGKSGFIIFSSRPKSASLLGLPLKIDSANILSKPHVRDLGVNLDNTLSMEHHIQTVRKSAFHQLRVIGKVRRYIKPCHTALLVNALALSRVEFCISLVLGVNKKEMTKLQGIIHYSMRLVEQLSKTDCVEDALKRHQWLSAQQRAKLRLATITFVALRYGVPLQLAKLLVSAQSECYQLRSQSDGKLVSCRSKTRAGDRAFEVAAPRHYNSLPLQLRQEDSRRHFVNTMKHHLLKT